jgi:hypothetical protein
MATRLAIVNCKSTYEGIWTPANGHESGLEIFTLGKGALIRFEWKLGKSIDFKDYHESGEHSLPITEFEFYRVSKVGDSGQPTIVRVQLNG